MRCGSLPGGMGGVGRLFSSKEFSRGKVCSGERQPNSFSSAIILPCWTPGQEIFARLMELFFYL